MRRTMMMVALALAAYGCGDSPEAEETRRQIGEAAERTGDYLAEQGRALRDQIATGLDGMDEHVEELRERAGRAGAEASERWEALSEEYSDERAVLREKMQEWRNASGEAAEKARREVEAAWENVRETYGRMRDEAGAGDNEPAEPQP